MGIKFLKPAAALAFGAVLLGFFLFGKDFFSYVRTSTRAVQDAVGEQVSIDFELKRAKGLVDEIIPQLQANVRMIAEDEVKIATLEKDIAASVKQLKTDRKYLSQLRTEMDVQQVSYRLKGREVSREYLAQQLAQAFDRYRDAEMTLTSKQKLLETRKNSLQAAFQMHDKAKHEKLLLEQKIQSLIAKHRLVQASAEGNGTTLQQTDLSRAQQLVDKLQTRLDVAQRVAEHEQDLIPLGVVTEQQEGDILAEFDEYFSPEIDNQYAIGEL